MSGAPVTKTWPVVKRMFGWFRPYWVWATGNGALTLLMVPLGIMPVLLIRELLDTALPEQDLRLLTLLCGLMLGAGLLNSALRILTVFLSNAIGQRVSEDLRTTVYERAGSQPLDHYTSESVSEAQSRLVSDINGIDKFVTGTLYQVLTSVTTLLVVALAMFVVSWPLAVLSLSMAGALAWLNQRFARKRRALARQRQRRMASVLKHTQESLTLDGVVLGRTLRRTGGQRLRFAELCASIRDLTIRQRTIGASANFFIGVSFASLPPLVFWVVGNPNLGTSMTVGSVVVVVMLQTYLTGPIESLLRLNGSFQAAMAQFERIIHYLDLPGSEGTSPQTRENGPEPSHGAHVCMEEVEYRYAGAGGTALSGVRLDLPSGSTTVVMGPTGSGKSSLALLLSGLVTPSTGDVHCDVGELRDVATLVSQQTFLLDASLRDNLAFTRDDVEEARMWEVLDVACLGSLVRALPKGLDTPVGQNGHQLSGGERQRLALARALLEPSPLLILDEATSALDAGTARTVHTSLRRYCAGRTLVIVTHHRPDLHPGDRLAYVMEGRVTMEGVHV